jgi:hypothetical protein
MRSMPLNLLLEMVSKSVLRLDHDDISLLQVRHMGGHSLAAVRIGHAFAVNKQPHVVGADGRIPDPQPPLVIPGSTRIATISPFRLPYLPKLADHP